MSLTQSGVYGNLGVVMNSFYRLSHILPTKNSLKLLPEYPLTLDTQCFEFFSGTLHHGWGTTDIELSIIRNIRRCYPVDDVAMSKSWTLFTREIGNILELGYCESEFSDLIRMKYIVELSNAEDKCYSRE